MNVTKSKNEIILEAIIFKGSKIILSVFYIIMLLALLFFAITDVKEFIHNIHKFLNSTKDMATLVFLEMIDLFLIAALGKMMITGGYSSYMSKKHGYSDENVGSGLLKVKLATSLIGVTSIALLGKSINISLLEGKPMDWNTLHQLAYIHCLFLAGALVVAIVDYWHHMYEIKIEEKGLKSKNLEDGVKDK